LALSSDVITELDAIGKSAAAGPAMS